MDAMFTLRTFTLIVVASSFMVGAVASCRSCELRDEPTDAVELPLGVPKAWALTHTGLRFRDLSGFEVEPLSPIVTHPQAHGMSAVVEQDFGGSRLVGTSLRTRITFASSSIASALASTGYRIIISRPLVAMSDDERVSRALIPPQYAIVPAQKHLGTGFEPIISFELLALSLDRHKRKPHGQTTYSRLCLASSLSDIAQCDSLLELFKRAPFSTASDLPLSAWSEQQIAVWASKANCTIANASLKDALIAIVFDPTNPFPAYDAIDSLDESVAHSTINEARLAVASVARVSSAVVADENVTLIGVVLVFADRVSLGAIAFVPTLALQEERTVDGEEFENGWNALRHITGWRAYVNVAIEQELIEQVIKDMMALEMASVGNMKMVAIEGDFLRGNLVLLPRFFRAYGLESE